MGFQGQLNSVNLTDLFQTLSMNRQTGTLHVTGEGQFVDIYFEQGHIARCSSIVVGGRPMLVHALQHKNLLTAQQADGLLEQFQRSRQGLRDLIIATGLVADPDLDEVSAWCVEELICPAFEWSQGEFAFTDGGPTEAVAAFDAIDLTALPLATPQLTMEATRRLDEWQRIREVIPEGDAYFIVDNEGRANLKHIESDPDMLKVLRYLDGRHTIQSITAATGVTRFDAHAIIAQLVLANVARTRSPQEAVEDAQNLRANGDASKARELLENTLRQFNVPEVSRPLAELCVELKDTPRAVDLYLDLIQRSQDGGDLEQALGDLETILTLSPNDPDLHFDRAQTLAELSRYDDAAQAYIQSAQQYLSLRKVDQAADACHRAKNLVPRNAAPHRFLAKAYLLEGQTENAIVEYKSLWHALLSDNRPRKALDELTTILNQDCKFAAVKDQVLAHAQSSEAVKTGNAVRILVYAVVGAVFVATAFIGWKIIDKEVIKAGAHNSLAQIRTNMAADLASLKHQQLADAIQEVAREYGKHQEITTETDSLLSEVAADAERRAAADLQTAQSMIAAGNLDEAQVQVQQILARFGQTKTAIEAKQVLVNISQARDIRTWMTRVQKADQHWNSDEWDEALAVITELSTQTEMPAEVRTALNERKTSWSTSLASSQDLFRRAERLENLGRKALAMEGYKRAMSGDGETYRARARERLVALENSFAKELIGRMNDAFAQQNDQTAFTMLDELNALAKKANTDEVRRMVADIKLPFKISLASPYSELVIRIKGESDVVVQAPKGTKNQWVHTLKYSPQQEIALAARRHGFTIEIIRVAADAKRSFAIIALKRGPLWQTDLGALPTTSPVACDTAILVGTSKSTLEVIDSNLGGSRPVVFPDSVSEVGSTPFVFGKLAFLVLDDRILCVDIDTRTVKWTWPGPKDLEQPQLHPQSLWVQEHELIQNRIQVFAGTTSGRLIALGATGNKATPFPSVKLDGGLTGSPAVVRLGLTSTLYVPAGPVVIAFDATSASEQSPPKRLYALSTRGDVVGRPAPAMVAKQPGVLITDSSGVVVALNADPASPQRTLGSWSLEGTPISGVIPHPNGNVGYVAVTEGRLILLDLAVPGRLIGRYPQQGSLGYLPGAPAVGKNGVYIADSNGILACLNAQTGELLWKADLGSQVQTGILVHQGRIYIPTKGGNLLCFEEGELD